MWKTLAVCLLTEAVKRWEILSFILNIVMESCRFQLLIVEYTTGNILFFIARLSKVYRINQSIGLSIYLRKLVFNNYDEQALLKRICRWRTNAGGTIHEIIACGQDRTEVEFGGRLTLKLAVDAELLWGTVSSPWKTDKKSGQTIGNRFETAENYY